MDLENMFKTLRSGAEALAQLSAGSKNTALACVAKALKSHQDNILKANEIDVNQARSKGMKESLVDRLSLNEKRIDAIIDSINVIINQTDPIGTIDTGWISPEGLHIRQVRVPIGVACIIYESRPNVTVDAFAIAYKSGNAILLRGSSSALESNKAIVTAIKDGLKNAGKDGITDAIELASSGERSEVDEILNAVGKIDVVLPRGGADLIKMVVEKARIPVIETGSGICHLFIDESANLENAVQITLNAKLQRPGVCNAIEVLLVHDKIKDTFLPMLAKAILGKAQLRCCEKTYPILSKTEGLDVVHAGKEDFDTEFLDTILAVKSVSSVEEAIEHINTHNTKHSESILTKNIDNASLFQRRVDASCVYVNASTRFTDGGVFGFGAELGISTQKFHIRGPMGLSALTTTKYLIDGEGHIR
jgi:glutamate-5-semialdehyde dehydrogenase